MPTEFRIEVDANFGPVKIQNYKNEHQCRELMLTNLANHVAHVVSENVKGSNHYSAWSRAIYSNGAGKMLMYLFHNEIHNVSVALASRNAKVHHQLMYAAPELMARYNGLVQINEFTRKDMFTGASTSYVVAKSEGSEAIAAMWWNILLSRLTENSQWSKSVYRKIRRIIESSNELNPSSWYRSSDKDAHLNLWNAGISGEAPVGEWFLYSTGPCTIRRSNVYLSGPSSELINAAKYYKIRDRIASLY